MYETIYQMLYSFAVWRISDLPVCRFLSAIILLVILLFSRLMSSFILKFFSVLIALIMYFLPDVILLFR